MMLTAMDFYDDPLVTDRQKMVAIPLDDEDIDDSFFDEFSDDLNGSAMWGYMCGSSASGNTSGLLAPASPPSSVPLADEFRFVIDVYVVASVCIFGFLGNALTIFVLKRDNEKSNPTSWLLQSLALVDSLYLMTCLFIQPIKALHDLTNRLEGLSGAYPHMEPYLWPAAAVAQTGTVWMVLLVTVDRYIAVCKPFKTKLRSLWRAKVSVVVVFALAVLYNIPHFFERSVVYVRNDCTGSSSAELRKSSFTSSSLYFIVYKTLCYFVFRTFGPLLLLTFLNHRLIRSLKTIRKRHDRMTKSSTRQKENITLMLVVVITVFIVCELPDVCLRVAVTAMELAQHRVNLDASIVYCANSFVNMLLSVNSAVNFIIYCLVGKKFRRILARRLCLCTPCASASTADTIASTGMPPYPNVPVGKPVAEVTSTDQHGSNVFSAARKGRQRSV